MSTDLGAAQRAAVTCCAVLLAFLAGAPSLLGGARRQARELPPPHRLAAAPSLAARGAALQSAPPTRMASLFRERERTPGAACAAEVCQEPRLVIPGLHAVRGSRMEAVLAFLSRSSFEPISRAARFVADRNLRVDFYTSSGAVPERGWGHLVVSLRWQLGAPAD